MAKYRFLILYAVGQGLAYGIDIGIFYALTVALEGSYAIVCNVSGKIVAAFFAYFFHRNYSFAGEKSNSRIQSIGYYIMVLIVNMSVTSVIIFMVQTMSNTNIVAVKFVADVFAIIVTFVLMDKFVFPRARQE